MSSPVIIKIVFFCFDVFRIDIVIVIYFYIFYRQKKVLDETVRAKLEERKRRSTTLIMSPLFLCRWWIYKLTRKKRKNSSRFAPGFTDTTPEITSGKFVFERFIIISKSICLKLENKLYHLNILILKIILLRI